MESRAVPPVWDYEEEEMAGRQEVIDFLHGRIPPYEPQHTFKEVVEEPVVPLNLHTARESQYSH